MEMVCGRRPSRSLCQPVHVQLDDSDVLQPVENLQEDGAQLHQHQLQTVPGLLNLRMGTSFPLDQYHSRCLSRLFEGLPIQSNDWSQRVLHRQRPRTSTDLLLLPDVLPPPPQLGRLHLLPDQPQVLWVLYWYLGIVIIPLKYKNM